MGINLVSITGDKFFFSRNCWFATCQLAKRNGWAPLGTIPPLNWPLKNWNPNDYFSEAGQSVLAIDALELSKAIERAIPNLPAESESNKNQYVYINYFESLIEIIDDFKNDDQLENRTDRVFVTKEHEGNLIGFIDLCRKGKFWII